MSCPPLHINRLSLDGSGWIYRDDDSIHNGVWSVVTIERPILPKCQRLLSAMHLSLSSDLFHAPEVTGECGVGGAVGGEENAVTAKEPLAHLGHVTNIVDKIIAAIEEIRQLGTKRQRGRGQACRLNGKVASLENQRRLRLQNEQKKLAVQQATISTSREEGQEAPEQQDEDEDMLDEDHSMEDEFVIPELRLAAVFNSLRVVIDITRPMLDHPQCQDFGIQMLNGPSIQKSGNRHRYYLFSKNVYSCAGANAWRRLKKSYSNLLEESEMGLTAKMSRQLIGVGGYELATKDWVASLFNHKLYLNKEFVANKCMELPSLNLDVASKLNAALIERFDNDRDGMQRLLQCSINKLHQHLTNAISRRFNGARLTVYGSCLSGLALEGSHDVDISIYIPKIDGFKNDFDSGKMSAEEYEKKMRKTIFDVRDCVQNYRSEQFSNLFAVTRARVPVIKGSMNAQNPHTPDGSLSFDLCFLNEIAVVNSSLLKEYSLFDKNVRLLMLSIKSFAKMNSIASAANGTLSSYTWLNLVIFYLQCVGMVPVLNCPKMMESHQLQYDPNDPWHSINGLQTLYLTKDVVMKKNIWQRPSHAIHTSPTMLMYGFFNFYVAIFPHQTVAASIRFGEMSLQKTCLHQSSKLWRMCVEDPFETCDSHCPHDLGCHVLDENCQKRINECLTQAKSMLESLLRKEVASDSDVSNLLSKLLWSNNSKSVKAKGSVGNQNMPAGRTRQEGNNRQNAPRNSGSRQGTVRQPHGAPHARILPNAQNERNRSSALNRSSAPTAQSGKSAPSAENGRMAPNAPSKRIAPNAHNQKKVTNDNPPPMYGAGKPAAEVRYQLLVGNLSWETNSLELMDHFSKVGRVEHSAISTNRSGRSLGVGFIRFFSDEDAKRAHAVLNGVEFMGRPLKIKIGINVR